MTTAGQHYPVAVTGATGALGSRIAAALDERGAGQLLVARVTADSVELVEPNDVKSFAVTCPARLDQQRVMPGLVTTAP